MIFFRFLMHVFIFLDTVQHGRLCVTAQSLTDLELYQPTEKISVDICDSAPLQCCIFNYGKGKIFWFKQEKRKAPVFIAGPFNHDGVTFYSEYQSSRFQIEKHGNCFVLTILNTTLSDEATYYCAVMISAGTYLQIGRISIKISHLSGRNVVMFCSAGVLQKVFTQKNFYKIIKMNK